jgi:hypothetical protein
MSEPADSVGDGMAIMSEGQTALLKQAEEVTSNVTDMTAARGRRGRQAA